MAFPAPELPISPHLPDPADYPGEPREYARALMHRKDEIEKEIDVLKDVLASHNVTTQTSLVDPEGYPRGDIDVYAIRHARAALTRLYNDRTTVTQLIATALEAAFAPASAPIPSSSSSTSTMDHAQLNGQATNCHGGNHRSLGVMDGATGNRHESWPERPVAKVNSVAPGSPADEANLKANDMIYSFAGVTSTTTGGLQAIGSVVARSEGVALPILLLRGTERITLTLTPRTGWGGRGSLGCHILPP